MPTSVLVLGSATSATSTTNDAKYLSHASLVTVTDDGSVGSCLDHRTSTSPILGRRSSPVSVIRKWLLLVNRMDWRLSFFDRNLGWPTLAPLRLPTTESKNAR